MPIFHILNESDLAREDLDKLRTFGKDYIQFYDKYIAAAKAYGDVSKNYKAAMGAGDKINLGKATYGSGIDRSDDVDFDDEQDTKAYLKSAGNSDIKFLKKPGYGIKVAKDVLKASSDEHEALRSKEDEEYNNERIEKTKNKIKLLRQQKKDNLILIDNLNNQLKNIKSSKDSKSIKFKINNLKIENITIEKLINNNIDKLRYYNSNIGKNMGSKIQKDIPDLSRSPYENDINNKLERKEELESKEVPSLEKDLAYTLKDQDQLQKKIKEEEKHKKALELISRRKDISNEDREVYYRNIDKVTNNLDSLYDKLDKINKDRVDITTELEEKNEELEELNSVKYNRTSDLASRIVSNRMDNNITSNLQNDNDKQEDIKEKEDNNINDSEENTDTKEIKSGFSNESANSLYINKSDRLFVIY